MKRYELKRLLAVAALSTAAGFAASAIAQVTPPPSADPGSSSPSATTPSSPGAASTSSADGSEYTKLDKDENGSLSKREVAGNKELTRQWNTLDANKDGKLDSAEFARFEVSGSAAPADSSKPADKPSDKPPSSIAPGM